MRMGSSLPFWTTDLKNAVTERGDSMETMETPPKSATALYKSQVIWSMIVGTGGARAPPNDKIRGARPLQ